MQEIKKPSIVIASILKPANDPRMFEKMGNSLIATEKWNVVSIGYGQTFDSGNIKVHPLGEFKRISLRRLAVPFKILWLLILVRPQVLIITTHELLNAAVTYKLFFKCKIYYDLQENYFLNILNTAAFPWLLRHVVAGWVRTKEWISKPFIHHYFLAEKSYKEELGFIGHKFSIIENRCWLPKSFMRKPNEGKLRVLFTGTVDASTGIWETIELCKKLFEADGRVELRIVGYCAIEKTRAALLSEIKKHSFISCPGIDKLISHDVILEEISSANAGIIYYPPSIHNRDRVPTKLYEYLACQLPILFDSTVPWKEMVSTHHGGVQLDFNNPNPEAVLNELLSDNFYPSSATEASWSSIEKTFLSALPQ